MSQLSVFIGRKVKILREEKGLSQEKLAADAGLHRTYIGLVEQAKRNITVENLGKITKVLGISLSDFFKCYEEFDEDYTLSGILDFLSKKTAKDRIHILNILNEISDWKDD